MLFSEKYPNANPNGTYEHGNYIYSASRDNCYLCGRITHFVESNMQCYVCSEECDEALYIQVFKEAMKS